ncbi:MAG: DUF885 family protein, partial [Flavobacteriaceae bacterium]
MNKITHLLLIALLAIGCTQKSASDQLNELMNTYHEENLKRYPISATSQGDARYNDYLPNFLSDEFIMDQKAFYTQTLDALNAIDKEQLDEADKLSVEVLRWECETSLMGMEFPSELLPIDQMWTLQLTIGQMASGAGAQPFNTVKDYENWLSRLDDYVVWLKSAKSRMEEGIEQ